MLKYWLVIILNTPLVVIGVARVWGTYKKGLISRGRLTGWLIFWAVIFAGIITAEPLYSYLQRHHLTDSSPLSLFDIITITGVITLLSLYFRLYSRHDRLERQMLQLNKEVSIRLKDDKK